MNSLHFSKIILTSKYNLIFVFIFAFLFSNGQVMGQNKDFVVVLDAGHGGKDPGKIAGKNMFEKDIALKIVLEVGDLLE